MWPHYVGFFKSTRLDSPDLPERQEPSYHTRTGPEQSNITEVQDKDFKTNSMPMMEDLEEALNKTSIEIQENTNKHFDEMNKFLKESEENTNVIGRNE